MSHITDAVDMTQAVDALLRWRTQAEGGRKRMPMGPRYLSEVYFGARVPHSTEPAWDLVVEFIDPPSTSVESRARVRYLADGAPSELLRPGTRFRLFEGPQCVAEGIVID
jgi:hypothetical protein